MVLVTAALVTPTAHADAGQRLQENTKDCFDAIYALNEQQLDKAIGLYTRCIDTGNLSVKNLIVAHNNRGNALGRLKQFDKALLDFDRVIELNPEDPDAYYNRGLTHKQLGNLNAALSDYEQTLKRNPRYAKAYNNRGGIFGARGLFQKAIGEFDQAIRLDDSKASAFYNRGLAHYSLGQYEAAIADLEQAIELDPKYAKAYEQLAWLRATCPDNRLQDGIMAVALARKARFLQPAATTTLFDILAASYAAAGEADRAVRYQQLAIESLPKNADNDVNALQQRLSIYKDGRSYREQAINRFLKAS